MKENTNTVCFRSIVACCLMFAVFATSSMVVFAMPDTKSATGELIVSGHNTGADAPFAMLNGERAFSGRTFFSSGTIATSEDNDATVKLGKLGSINLAANSILSLSFGENKISGNLIAGQVKVFSNEGVEVKIQTADQVVSGDASRSGTLSVDARTGATAQTGQQTASDDDNSYVGPLIVFAGIVAVAAIYVIRHNNNNNKAVSGNTTTVVSPTR